MRVVIGNKIIDSDVDPMIIFVSAEERDAIASLPPGRCILSIARRVESAEEKMLLDKAFATVLSHFTPDGRVKDLLQEREPK